MITRVAMVGHVDNGKSTAIGRMLSDSGQTRDDRVERVRDFCSSSGKKFEYAFLLDALEEEQSQGITIDVTEVNCRLEDRDFQFVDTPGHQEFIKKMVGGASSVEAAVLIVDAVQGFHETILRQSHILDLLGVKNKIYLVNKMDLINWDAEKFAQIREKIHAAFGGSSGPIIPVAAWHGDNILNKSENMPWYQGPTFASALLEIAPARAAGLGRLRFSVQDVYPQDDRRIYVGRVESGKLQVGDRLTFFPNENESTVTSIEVYDETRNSAHTGEAIGITLSDTISLDRGSIGYRNDEKPRIERKISADIFWLDESALSCGAKIVIKADTRSAHATIEKIHHVVDRNFAIHKGVTGGIELFGRAEIRFNEDWAYDSFNECETMGRFAISRAGQLLGGGRFIDQVSSSMTLGRVFWLTGLSGAGKSTIAKKVAHRLAERGMRSVILDGDALRSGLCSDLGFSAEDRTENNRRATEVAKLLSDSGCQVIVALISPMSKHREFARSRLAVGTFFEIHVDCSLETCEMRDTKGFYRKSRLGELAEFTGIDSPYEIPTQPSLRLDTEILNVEAAAELILDLI